MKISSSHTNRFTLGNKAQVSRDDRYKATIRISDEDRKEHLDIDWDPDVKSSSLLERDGDQFTVSNFRWGREETGETKADWAQSRSDTTIDTSQVKDVYMAVQPFKPEIIAGHGLVIFEMAEDGAVQSSTGETDFGLAFSAEAKRPVGVGFDLIKGMKKSYGLTVQLGSLSDQLQMVSRQRGNKLLLHKLDLEPEQKKELLQNALENGTKDRTGEWYHTLTNSCYTNCVDLINSVVSDDKKMPRWTATPLTRSRAATSIPNLSGATVRKKGLHADVPTVVLNPDAELYPDTQTKEAKGFTKVLAKASRSRAWRPSFQAAGAALGGVAGYALGASLFGQVGTAITTAAGVAGGMYTGDRTSDFMAVTVDRTPIGYSEWYSQQGGLTIEEATQRLTNPAAV